MGKFIGVPLEGFEEKARQAAAEGAVLLKNEKDTLPFKKGECISIFGRIQINYYRSGTGSGGAVNVVHTTSFLDAMRAQGNININETLAEIYEAWVKENPFDDGGGGWAAEPWHQKEMPLNLEEVKKAREKSEKAVMVIGRTAGEDKDNTDTEGSYGLTSEEKDMLKIVCSEFSKVVLLLNVSNNIDLSWLEESEFKSSITAVILAWQGGVAGADGISDVLCGIVTASGKLTSTIAFDIKDYPSTTNYGGKIHNYYEEDIYVGYRYFSTFSQDKVQFPFGFGLSYTEFLIEDQSATFKEDILSLSVSIKNIGKTFSGKEVVQVYCEAPQGKLGQPKRKLIGFAKTKKLEPGEVEKLEIKIPVENLASYDDSGVTGYKSAYVLEKGEYGIFVGNGLNNLQKVHVNGLNIENTIVVEQLQEALAPIQDFKRMRPKREAGSYEIEYENVPKQTIDLEERIQKNLPNELEISGDKGISLKDVHNGKADLDAFIKQLSIKDLAAIVRGEGMCSPKVTPGTASAFGGVTEKLFSLGIPLACAADGPSGIRMEGGLMATQLPIGTLLASTWDTELIEELYVMEGQELCRNEIDTLLGPGMNIQRNPLNGRNFEYFSEDPLLTGKCASAVIRGIRKGGSTTTIKHFAVNNQETYRTEVDSVVSERALREIYLKGFEIAVKEGGATSVMTSYNPINGHWAASNYDLVTTILRKEWGFQGIVMTDWWAKMNDVVNGGEATVTNTRSMVRAQNDLYMVVDNYGAEVNTKGDNTEEAVLNGTLTIGELQQCAKNICSFLTSIPAFFREQDLIKPVIKFSSLKKENENIKPLSVEEAITVNGEEKEYCIYVKQNGIYGFIVNGSASGGNMAQSTCNFYLNEEIVVTMQLNGTEGRQVSQKIGRVELEQGIYNLHIEYPTPGIKLNWIELKRED